MSLGESAAMAYLGAVLTWLHDLEQGGYPPVVAGRTRAHAVWHGDALAAAPALAWVVALDAIASRAAKSALVLSAGIDGDVAAVALRAG